MIEAPNRTTATKPATAELARDVHQQCQRALRRLRTLAREQDDVLLAQAMRSVNRAAAESCALR
jgi:hypothetical protein